MILVLMTLATAVAFLAGETNTAVVLATGAIVIFHQRELVQDVLHNAD